jgi:hypothetical protein
VTTPTQSAIGFPRAAESARSDLKAIWSRLPTMHDECWCPRRPDHDRSTPTLPAGFGPDDVPGPTWDCGQGDHRARQGWQRMIGHIETAQTTQAAILEAILPVRRGLSVVVCRPTSLLDAQHSVRTLRGRLSATQALWEDLDVPRQQWLARQLMGPRGNPDGSCFDEIRLAMCETQRVVREVGTGKPPAVCPRCRRVGSIGQPRKGGLCFACDKQAYRMGRRQRQTTVRAWKRDNC